MDKGASAIDWLHQARGEGRAIFFAVNGGSSTTASHFVCDMVKGASFGRASRFGITALHDSVPAMTAYSNDMGYAEATVEQLRNFAHWRAAANRQGELQPQTAARHVEDGANRLRLAQNAKDRDGYGCVCREVLL